MPICYQMVKCDFVSDQQFYIEPFYNKGLCQKSRRLYQINIKFWTAKWVPSLDLIKKIPSHDQWV